MSFGEPSNAPYRLAFLAPTVEVISENEMRRLAFGSPQRARGAHKKLKAWRDAAFYAWKEQRFGRVGAVLGQPCIVQVHIGFRQHRRRDPHNYVGTIVKSIVDGLVLAGVWPDDTPEWVQVAEPKLVVHRHRPIEQALPCEVEFYLRGGEDNGPFDA
jgi:hypothetical protein